MAEEVNMPQESSEKHPPVKDEHIKGLEGVVDTLTEDVVKALDIKAEKKQLTPDHIFILAMQGAVPLTAEDKKSLPVDHLFMLALRGVAHLTSEDRQRLPSDDLTHLQMRGLA